MCVCVFHFDNAVQFLLIRHVCCLLSKWKCVWVCFCMCRCVQLLLQLLLSLLLLLLWFYLDCPIRSQSSIFSSSGSSIDSGTVVCRQISYLCRRLSSIWLCSLPSSYCLFWFVSYRFCMRAKSIEVETTTKEKEHTFISACTQSDLD